MRRFPRSPKRWNFIEVTFLPRNICMIYIDPDGRGYFWCRTSSPFLQDQTTMGDLLLVARDLPKGRCYRFGVGSDDKLVEYHFLTIKIENATVARRCSKSLIRYIQRGVSPIEVPALMVTYGFLKQFGDVPGLTEAVRNMVEADMPTPETAFAG
jgi:hypothetical protein